MTEEILNKRRRLLRNLVVMAVADGSLGEREVNLVADRCLALGLNEDDLRQAIEFGLGDDAALELPAEQTEREALLEELVRVMAADAQMEESEKRLFALAAVMMDLTREDVDRIIDKTINTP
ncbi:Tellurite resistance protein TerB [Novipirellula aureliae]|uniref:Tellurite resistance protein TerB n=1 Tax=Novipirellula aureliae TaxID=2527966 RepID=A0A5C6E541_9BACT|nr:TerB family tellurite resistance protein [Novipirellula aureliae]TWU43057.1 Tellurite resistance protein TerB [Novipirellula aureliae]